MPALRGRHFFYAHTQYAQCVLTEKILHLRLALDALVEAQRLVAAADPEYVGSHNFEILQNHVRVLLLRLVDEREKRVRGCVKSALNR